MNKEQLEAMSDFDINKLVAFSIGLLRKGKTKKYYDRVMPDYCNNPSDMMPLVFENKIDLVSCVSNGTEEWQAIKFYITWKAAINIFHKNPLRAAAIVYLLMHGEK